MDSYDRKRPTDNRLLNDISISYDLSTVCNLKVIGCDTFVNFKKLENKKKVKKVDVVKDETSWRSGRDNNRER